MRFLTLSVLTALPICLASAMVACGGGDEGSTFGTGDGSGATGTGGAGTGANGTGANGGGGAPGAGADYQGPVAPPMFPGEVDDPTVVDQGYEGGGVTIGGEIKPPAPTDAPTVEGVTDWFNGARAAYTIIHDDVCDFQMKGVEENWQVVSSRGLVAGWGIIISRCDRTATGNVYNTGTMWSHVKDLANGGQEIVNHSWNHPNIFGIAECSDKCMDEASCQASCPLEFRQPQVDANLEVVRNASCDYEWGNMRGTPDQIRSGANEALDLELIRSGARTAEADAFGTKPLFFAFPLDLANDTILQRLKDDGLLGARGGIRDLVGTVNPADVDVNDPLADFRITFDAYNEDAPGASRHEDGPGDMLKNYLDETIKKGGWGLRELHSIRPVDGEGGHGWGPVTLSKYETHLDEVKALVESRVLWNASNVDVIKYRRVRAHCGAPTLSGGSLSFAGAADPMCQAYGAGMKVSVSIAGPATMSISGADTTVVAPGRVLVHVDPTQTTALTIQ